MLDVALPSRSNTPVTVAPPPPRAPAGMRALAPDAAVLLAERGARLLAGLVVAVLCARILGPEGYGLYTYALSLVALFSFLGQAGLEQILVRELVRRSAVPEPTLAAAFLLRAAGAVGTAVLAVLTAGATSSTELPATLLVSLLALSGLLQASHVLDAWLQAQRAFRPSAAVKTTSAIVAALARVAAALSPAPLLALALVSLAEAALTGALLWRAATQRGLQVRHSFHTFDREELRRLWLLARPMLISSFAVALYARGDVFLLGQLSTRSEVGQYSAATSLSEVFYVLPIALMTAASPRLTALHQADPQGFRRECLKLVRYSSIAGFTLAIAVSLLSSKIVALIYGPAFTRAPAMLAIHTWSTWMVFISVASEPWYLNLGLQRYYVGKTAIAAAVNLILNVFLIPRYGGVGAAIATVASYALSAFGCNVLWHDTRPLFLLQLRAMLTLPSPFRRA